MEKKYSSKEEYKTMQLSITESNNNKQYYNTQDFQFKNRLEYSKRVQTKNMTTINKFFSRDRMLLEIPKSPKIKNIFKINYNKNKKKKKKEGTVEKEKLITQLIISKKDMDKINNEFKEYKDFYHKLEESNMTFKVIMEKILKIRYSDNDENNNEYKIISNKKKDKKLDPFKKQISEYEKDIEIQEKLLFEAKRDKKIKDFYELNQSLKEINNKLENLILKYKNLQITNHKKQEEINYYYNEIINLREESYKMKEKIKLNEKLKNNLDDEIYKIEDEKDQIVKNLNSLIEESINVEVNNENKKNESKKFSKEYEKIQDIKKEKEKDENELFNITNKIDNMKKTIEKNNNKINLLNYDNDEMENDIYIMQSENDKLNEKFKLEQKIKNYEKEIKLIKQEIEKNKSKPEEKKNENKEAFFLTIPEDKDKIEKNILLQKIEALQNELEEKKKENDSKQKELEKIKEEYNSLKNIEIKNNS